MTPPREFYAGPLDGSPFGVGPDEPRRVRAGTMIVVRWGFRETQKAPMSYEFHEYDGETGVWRGLLTPTVGLPWPPI